MKATIRGAAVVTTLLATAVVFSPFSAALAGMDVGGGGLRRSWHGVGALLAVSSGSALVSALVALSLGTPFAICVERARLWPRRILWTFGLLVLMVPPYIVAESWIVLLGPVGKISKAAALWLGFGPRSGDSVEVARYVVAGFVYTWPCAGAVTGACLFPVIALAVASTLRRTDRRIFEAARLAQGSPGIRRLAARLLVPPALGGALLVFALALTEFAVPQLLRVRTIGEVVYARIQEGELATAAVLSLPLPPIVLFFGALGAYILTRSRAASMAGLEGEVPTFTGRAGSRRDDWGATVVSLCALTPSLILSTASLVWLAVAAKLPAASTLGTHKVLRASGMFDSLRGAWELAHSDAIRTVFLASLGATLATIFAIFLARLAFRTGWSWLLGVLGAGLAVPAPIIGLGLITLWNHAWSSLVYQSPAIVLLGWFSRFLPLVVLLVQSALARIPSELESAAALAGRGAWGRFCSVVLPNAAPGLAAAWLAMYVLSATEFSATLLIAPPGSPMLAPSVVNLMRRGQDPEIAACQLLLLAVVALPLVVAASGTAAACSVLRRKSFA